MAFFDQSARAPLGAHSGFFSGLRAAVQRYTMMRRTYSELASLSDRELDDLGIARGDLYGIARHSAGYHN